VCVQVCGRSSIVSPILVFHMPSPIPASLEAADHFAREALAERDPAAWRDHYSPDDGHGTIHMGQLLLRLTAARRRPAQRDARTGGVLLE